MPSTPRVIDEKLKAGPFANTAKIFAAPRVGAVGDVITPAEIAAELRRSGYNESRGNPDRLLPDPARFDRDLPRHATPTSIRKPG